MKGKGMEPSFHRDWGGRLYRTFSGTDPRLTFAPFLSVLPASGNYCAGKFSPGAKQKDFHLISRFISVVWRWANSLNLWA